MTSKKHFSGHGGAINDLKFHPKHPSVLLSASKDFSIRMWNIETDVCIAIFGALDGHVSEVLSADFNAMGSRIATSGMDNKVIIWNLNKSSIQKAIEESFTFNLNDSRRGFRTVLEHYPEHSVHDIHNKYVDCVEWMGNFIISKV